MQNMFVLIVPMKATSNQKASPWTVPVKKICQHLSRWSICAQTMYTKVRKKAINQREIELQGKAEEWLFQKSKPAQPL